MRICCGEHFSTLVSICVKGLSEEFFDMWAKLIVSVTLLPMLIHSTFGCCWHHAHSECDLSCVRSTVRSHAGQCQHSHAPAQCLENTKPFVPAPCGRDKPCDDVCCVYLAAESVRIVFSFDLHAYATILNSSSFMYRGVSPTTPTNAYRNRCVFTAVEHCALTQVWVV